MGLFSIFTKKKQNDNIVEKSTQTKQVTPTLTPEEVKLKAKKDLTKLNGFEKKIQEKEDIRTIAKKDNANEKTERPEEKRAREALSINNPFRGI